MVRRRRSSRGKFIEGNLQNAVIAYCTPMSNLPLARDRGVDLSRCVSSRATIDRVSTSTCITPAPRWRHRGLLMGPSRHPPGGKTIHRRRQPRRQCAPRYGSDLLGLVDYTWNRAGIAQQSSIGLRNAGQMVEPCPQLGDDLLAPLRHLIAVQQLNEPAFLECTKMRVQPAHLSLSARLTALAAEPRRAPTTRTRRLQLTPTLDTLCWSILH